MNHKKVLLLLFFLSALSIPPFLGEGDVALNDVLSNPDSVSAQILLSVRLPRIVFAFLVGSGLALIGALFQALLRNDLATPYTLGVSSGGALGAVIAIKSGLIIQIAGFSTVSLFSIGGSLFTVMLIYWIAGRRREMYTFALILAGITISLFFSALNLFIHYLADFTETFRMVRWLMGSLDVAGWAYPLILLTTLIPVYLYLYFHIPAYNLLMTGEEIAMSKGVQVRRLQRSSFIIGSVLVGIIVSVSGPIGFIGLIVPHLIRLLYGPDHRFLFPASVLLGGAFLVWCDTLARTIIMPAELPVGIITALLGGPFFIYLLVIKKK